MDHTTHVLSSDTQAIMLLCASFQADKSDGVAPLTLGEYNQLAQWLRTQALRPSDLLEPGAAERLRRSDEQVKDVERIVKLLHRGAVLALQVESWTNQGFWVISRSDKSYPKRLKDRLKHRAPPILYGTGDAALLSYGGLAIVGSRNADTEALAFTHKVATLCVSDAKQIISGGAKGVDQTAMQAGVDAGGNVVGILADGLAKASVIRASRDAIREGRMVLASPYAPHVGFSVGNAMARNKLIYALADWTVVVSTEIGKGGTWTGAIEALKLGLMPVFVRTDGNAPPGNEKLIALGAKRLESRLLHKPNASIASILDQVQDFPPQQPASSPDQLPSIVAEAASHEPTADVIPTGRTIDHQVFWNEIIWPLILQLAAKEGSLNKAKLSSTLDITTAQADAWLQRAVAEGKLRKRAKPVRYVLVEGEQMNLISSE